MLCVKTINLAVDYWINAESKMVDFNFSSVIFGFVTGLFSAVLVKQMNLKKIFFGFFKKSGNLSIFNNGEFKMVLVVRSDLNMGKGKIAAQCCHAALGSYKKAEKHSSVYLKEWISQGQRKIVVKLDNQDNEVKLYELEKLARLKNVPCMVVHDAGHTQVKRGTATCAGFGPAPSSILDEITGNLKLL